MHSIAILVVASLTLYSTYSLEFPPSEFGRHIDHDFAVIERLQNPKDCSTVQKVYRVRGFQRTGFGALLHQLVGILKMAVKDTSVLIFDEMPGKEFQYGLNVCGNSTKSWECFFEPLSRYFLDRQANANDPQ